MADTTTETGKVPAEAQAALQAVVDSGQAEWYLSGGEKIEFTAIGFCTWYMAERSEIEKQVREQVAKAIEANPMRECSGAVAECARIARGAR
jgi:hypothetical protein